MSRILVVPEDVTEYELRDMEVEIIILHKNMKRLDIQYAPSLKKIVSFSDYIVFGPKEVKTGMPVLNNCKNLNEIITFGYIKFNTMISNNGLEQICAWTGINNLPPTLTSVGSEYFGTFPCYYYDLSLPVEEVDSSLVYAYPVIRECPLQVADTLICNAITNYDEVSRTKFRKRLARNRITRNTR